VGSCINMNGCGVQGTDAELGGIACCYGVAMVRHVGASLMGKEPHTRDSRSACMIQYSSEDVVSVRYNIDISSLFQLLISPDFLLSLPSDFWTPFVSLGHIP